jgi:hypothetical protein
MQLETFQQKLQQQPREHIQWALPKARALLSSAHLADDLIVLVRWLPTWGWVVMDRKGRITLIGHGKHGELNIGLTASLSESVPDLEMVESADGDIVVLFPGSKTQPRVFCYRAIVEAKIKRANVVSYERRLTLRSGALATPKEWIRDTKLVRCPQVHSANNTLFESYETRLRSVFDFTYCHLPQPSAAASAYLTFPYASAKDMELECSVEPFLYEEVFCPWLPKELCALIASYCPEPLRLPTSACAYAYRGVWKPHETYGMLDMVEFGGFFWIYPSYSKKHSTPLETWSLFESVDHTWFHLAGVSQDPVKFALINNVQCFALMQRTANQMELLCGHQGVISRWTIAVS